MKRLGFVLAAAGAAVIGLTACTDSSGSGGTSTGQGSQSPVVPVSCREQYRTWTQGEGKGVMGTLESVTSAVTRGNARRLTGVLKHAKPAVARAAANPIPACADPRGYWSALLMHVNAAVSGKSAASSVRAALEGVPQIHRQLVAEVKQTAQ
jgi:hypothetical protein